MKSIMQEASSIAKAIEQGWIKAGKPVEFTVKVYEEAQKNFIGFTTKSAKIAILFNEHASTTSGIKHQADSRQRSTPADSRRPQPAQRTHQAPREHAPRDRDHKEFTPRAKTQHQRPERPAHHNGAAPAKTESAAPRQAATLRTVDPRSQEPRKEHTPREHRTQQREQQPRESAPREHKKPEGSGTGEGHNGPINVWSSEMVGMAHDWTKQALNLINKPLHITPHVSDNNLMLRLDAPILEDTMRDKVFQRSFAFLVMQMLKNKFKKRFKGLKIILEKE